MAVKRLHLVSIQGECHSQGVQILDRSFAQAMDFARAGRAIEAAQLFRQLAEAGHPGALITLGDCYWRGAGAVQDLARGRELFKAASGAGHPMAVRAWTNLLSSGIAGERRWPEALARLENEATLKVRGRRGDALVFLSVGPDNQFDPLSEHAGLPVRNGTKYVASRWIREARHTP